MKSLTKYLNPKSKWHGYTFPSTQDIEDYKSFFETNKFVKLKLKDNYYDIIKKFSKENDACYMIDDDYDESWIRFKNVGEITEDNPLFFLFISTPKRKKARGYANNAIDIVGFWSTLDREHTKNFQSYKEFLDEVNKVFNKK